MAALSLTVVFCAAWCVTGSELMQLVQTEKKNDRTSKIDHAVPRGTAPLEQVGQVGRVGRWRG